MRILLTELFNALYEGYHVVNDLSMDVLDPDQLLLALTTAQAQPHEQVGAGLGEGRCILDLTLYAALQDSCRAEYLETKELCKYFKMDCNKALTPYPMYVPLLPHNRIPRPPKVLLYFGFFCPPVLG